MAGPSPSFSVANHGLRKTLAPERTMDHITNHLGQPVGRPLPHWRAASVPTREPLQGRFCRLESLEPGLHAVHLHKANALDAEGSMWTYLPYGPFDSLGSYRAWVEEMGRRDDPLLYAITDLARGTPVGVAGYLRMDPKCGSIEVGHLAYSPLLQRTPAATEAMFLLMERAFALGYRRYEWKCDALNGPSRAAALRLGFTFEGIFRQATVVKGRSRDTAWFSIIDSEWPAIREAFRRWLDPANFDERGEQRVRLSVLTAGKVGEDVASVG